MSRQQPEQQAPPVQRLRLRYAKQGPARFTSHRDFGRAFERALRRGEIPMAYSSGFSPHPRISYGNASPTSAATQAEYLEIGLSQVCDPVKVKDSLNEALPPGMEVLEVVEGQSGSLADLLGASAWTIDLGEVDQAALEQAVEALMASQSWQVQRMTKSGLRDFDVRSAVLWLQVAGPGQLHLVSVQGTPLVRPDDVVTALRAAEPALASSRPALLQRVIQGNAVGGDGAGGHGAPSGDPQQLTDAHQPADGPSGGGVWLLDPFTGEPVNPW